MKSTILIILFLIPIINISGFNVSNLNYQAYFAIGQQSRMALVTYNDRHLYLVKGDTLAEIYEVTDVNGDFITLRNTLNDREYNIDLNRPADTASRPATQPESSRPSRTAPSREPASRPSQRTPEIYLEPQNFNISWANARATLIIMARGFSDLYSVSINISYDSSLVEVDNINEGHFMRSRGATTDFSSSISGGYLDIDISRLEETGASGNGMVASIIFRPLESGTTDFEITSITAYDSDFNPLDIDTANSVINIQIPEIDEEQAKFDEKMLMSDTPPHDLPVPERLPRQ